MTTEPPDHVMGTSGAAVPSALPPQFRHSVGFLLNKAAQIVSAAFQDRLKEFGVTAREFGVLQLVDLEGPRSQQQIGQVLGIDRTTMVSLIDHLERSGMVTRVKDPADRRRYAVSLTDQGSSRLKTDFYTIQNQVSDWFLEGIDKADSDHLVETLEQLVEKH